VHPVEPTLLSRTFARANGVDRETVAGQGEVPVDDTNIDAETP
jgi:hypothetical protein